MKPNSAARKRSTYSGWVPLRVAGGGAAVFEGAASCSYLPFSFLWLIIVLPKTIAAGFYVVLLIWLFANRKTAKQLSGAHRDVLLLMILATGIYIISIFRAMFIAFDWERLIAAFGTLLSWFLAFGYMYYYMTCKRISWTAISKRLTFNFGVLLLLLIIYYALGSAAPGIAGRRISSIDYLSTGSSTRFNAFMEYPTLISMFVLISYAASVYWVNLKYKLAGVLLLSAVCILSISAAASRAGLFAVLAIAAMGVVYAAYSQSARIRHYFIPLGILLVIGVCECLVLFGPAIVDGISEIINSRSGSTGGRLYIYEESISMTLSESPIIGMGVKYASSLSNDAPFGSHSTWIGLFYKTGFIGLVVYGMMFYKILRMQLNRVSRNNSYEVFLTACMAIVYCYLCFEDVDGTAWVCVLFFSLIAARMNALEALNVEAQDEQKP